MSGRAIDRKSREVLAKLSLESRMSQEPGEKVEFTKYDNPSSEDVSYEHEYSTESLKIIEKQLDKIKS